MNKLFNRDDARIALRRGSAAKVRLSISHSRYLYGEAVIETLYTLLDGSEDSDSPVRIFLSSDRRKVVTQLWDKLFNAVLVARDYDAAVVTIDFHRGTLEAWTQDFLIAVFIAAHELDVPVTGVFLASLLVQPAKVRNLSDDLDRALFGEGDEP